MSPTVFILITLQSRILLFEFSNGKQTKLCIDYKIEVNYKNKIFINIKINETNNFAL